MKFSLQKDIFKAVKKAFPQAKLELEEINLEHPVIEKYGDYSSNIALRLAKELGQNPHEVAEKIVSKLKNATVAGPARLAVVEARQGFVNITLDNEFLLGKLSEILKDGEKYGYLPKNGKKIVIEIVSPNINKPLHIGHLRNGALGMSIANAYKMAGWKVIKDEINNDRGLHIMKAAYGYLLFGQLKPIETKEWKELLKLWLSDPKKWETPTTTKKKPDYFVGEFYVKGEKFLTENEEYANKQLSNMLQEWEAEGAGVWKLWKTMADWVHEGIDATYLRIGVEHDKKWYEHLLYKEGKDVIMDALKKGILEKLPDGAIQANLEKYGMANKILIRRDGTAIYMTFDIALTRHKVLEFKADNYVWVVGNDQIDHFKRLFIIFEMLGLGKKEDFYHLAYGMVRIPGGKMSSRLGNVVLADDLIDKIVEFTKRLMDDRKIEVDSTIEEKRKIAEVVGMGAIKYAMLKVNPMIDVVFDMDKSVSLEGDSGPYLQYTYARAKSVINKSKSQLPISNNSISNYQFTNEELSIMRHIYKFPEVVEMAAKTFSPNLLCSYLFELAKRFNSFYTNSPILGNDFRLALTRAVSIVLANGLGILGIEAVEKM